MCYLCLICQYFTDLFHLFRPSCINATNPENSSPESFYIALLVSTSCIIKTKLKIAKNLNCAPDLLLISLRYKILSTPAASR